MKYAFFIFLSINFYAMTLTGTENIFLSVSAPPTVVRQFEPLQTEMLVNLQLINPFNVRESGLVAKIQLPSGEMKNYYCFYDGEKNGASLWRFRFTPRQLGKYLIQFEINDKKISQQTKTFSINVIPGQKHGFLRRDEHSFYGFRFDDGTFFRGIGENVAWAEDYEYYFSRLAKYGANFVRIWMCPWNLSLEWKESGLGRYNLKNAARLDSVLNLARRYGIYVMLCFDYHGVVQRDQGYFKEKKWGDNPYNFRNGGPCRTEGEFFTSQKAKKFYKQRLDYIVARWGYNPQIAAWEFWNEVDLTAGKPKEVIGWHAEMAKYLREIDPYDHLITTSFSGEGYLDIWHLEEMDFSQTHHYNQPDFTHSLPATISELENQFHKPHVVGEFGVDFRGPDESREADPTNLGIHNGLWVGLFSPTPILPLSWWWNSLLDDEKMDKLFSVISDVNEELFSSLAKNEIRPYQKIELISDVRNKQDDLVIFPRKPWGKNNRENFSIQKNGVIKAQAEIPTFLYGKEKLHLRRPPVFQIEYEQHGFFRLHVKHVSDRGMLRVFLDEKLVFEKNLDMNAANGVWKKRQWNEQWKIFQGEVDKLFEIPIPAGNHRIRVQNDGTDWLEIGRYEFVACGFNLANVVQICGLFGSDMGVFWVRHADFFWKQMGLKKEAPLVTNLMIELPDFTVGDYLLRWIDTNDGSLIEEFELTSPDFLHVRVPKFKGDIGLLIKRIS